MKHLFNGLPKGSKIYSKDYYRLKMREWRLNHREEDLKAKRKYYLKNKELLNQKDKIRRQGNHGRYNQKNTNWRRNNHEMMKTYGIIQHYRSKQKALALHYLRNEEYSPSTPKNFHSVSTNSLSYLLRKAIIL
ncbi:MAG: hypothetical protein ABIH53_00920 [archaeon]